MNAFMHRRLALPVLALVVLLLPAAASAGPLRGVQMPTVRADTPTSYLLQQLELAHRVHAQVVRTEVQWNALEPTAKGVRDAAYLAQIDAFFAYARSTGMRVMVTLASTPCWASTNADCAKAAGFPPKDPADYAAVAGFLAGRYGSELAALEIWNEPDHDSEIYFGGPDKPARYAAIVRATYPTVKRASPSTKVLAGSLVGANGAFLSALYAKGIKGYYDAISVHYYDLVLASLRNIRDVQRKHGDTKPIWVGEFGWTSCYPATPTQGGHTCVTSAVQAQNLVDIFAALRKTSWVQAAIVYDMQDSDQYDFGLVDKKGALKPSFAAMAKAFVKPPAPRPVVLHLKRSGHQVIAYGSAPAGDALDVAVRDGTDHVRFEGSFLLDRNDRYSLRLPAKLGTRGLQVTILQYWDGNRATKRI